MKLTINFFLGDKKRKTDNAIERIANALSEPIPPPQILQPLLSIHDKKEG